MMLRISGKHMDIGNAFRIRIEDRIGDAVSKYFDKAACTGHVTVVKSGSRYCAECMLHLGTGAILQTTGEAQNPQFAFDAAAERIEKRLRRYKRRLKSHQNGSIRNSGDNIIYRVMEAAPDEDIDLPENYAPTIVAETSMALRGLSVADAVIELDLMDNPVLVFRNAGNDGINIVYRRADGNIGWIDPSMVRQSGKI